MPDLEGNLGNKSSRESIIGKRLSGMSEADLYDRVGQLIGKTDANPGEVKMSSGLIREELEERGIEIFEGLRAEIASLKEKMENRNKVRIVFGEDDSGEAGKIILQ